MTSLQALHEELQPLGHEVSWPRPACRCLETCWVRQWTLVREQDLGQFHIPRVRRSKQQCPARKSYSGLAHAVNDSLKFMALSKATTRTKIPVPLLG